VAALEERILAAGRLELVRLRPARRKPFWAFSIAVAAVAALFFVLFRFSAPSPALHESEDVSGDAWSFVDGDSANSRHLEGLEMGMPTRVLWEKRVTGLAGTYKPLAWKGLVIIGSVPPKFRSATGRVDGPGGQERKGSLAEDLCGRRLLQGERIP